MSSFLYHLIIITTSPLLYQLAQKSVLALFRAKSLYVAYESNKQFTLIVGLQKLLADQYSSNLVVVEQERYPHIL